MKKIQSEQQNAERYRLQMSDGSHYQPCMLATQMNEKIQSGEMDKYSVVQVSRYLCNTIHQRRSSPSPSPHHPTTPHTHYLFTLPHPHTHTSNTLSLSSSSPNPHTQPNPTTCF